MDAEITLADIIKEFNSRNYYQEIVVPEKEKEGVSKGMIGVAIAAIVALVAFTQ